jgi:hypothetical protein
LQSPPSAWVIPPPSATFRPFPSPPVGKWWAKRSLIRFPSVPVAFIGSASGGVRLAGQRGELLQSTDRLHLKRAAVLPQPLRLQSPLRHCWDCPGGTGSTVNNRELFHAWTQVRTSCPPPLKRPSSHSSGPPLGLAPVVGAVRPVPPPPGGSGRVV